MVTPLHPPTQLLTWPHCCSFTDPSTLLLEWICRVRHAAKVFRCFTANVHLVGTFTVLPKLFVTSGQEVARVVFRQFLIWQEEEPLLYSLIIMTHLDPLT